MNNDSPAYRTVSSGIELVYFALCLLIITLMWVGIGAVIVRENVGIAQIYTISCAAGLTISGILDVTGRIKCRSLPDEVGGGAKAIGSSRSTRRRRKRNYWRCDGAGLALGRGILVPAYCPATRPRKSLDK